MLLALTPNVEFEMVTGEHSSVNLGAFGHSKPYGFNSEVLGLQAEYRYWFNGRPMTREYIGLGALGTTYKMQLGDYMYDGDAAREKTEPGILWWIRTSGIQTKILL